MKWFYITVVLVTIALSLSPFMLLEKSPTAGGDDTGKVVWYNVYGSKVRSIDPATAGDTTSASIQGNIYEGLYTYHYLKRPVEVVTQLAAQFPQISPDGLTYTIPIRRGIHYARNACFGTDASGRHGTREVVAQDFELAFKRIADYHVNTRLSLAFIEDKIEGLKEFRNRTQTYQKGDFSRYYKERIEGVTVLDDYTLRIKLIKPFPQLLYVLAMNSYAPVPREVIEYHLATRDDGAGGREPIPINERSPEILTPAAAAGTGPYVLTEWVKAGKIILERNDEFREEYYPVEGAPGDAKAGLLDDAYDAEGRRKRIPFIDVVDLTFVQENLPAWQLFEAKKRDSAGIPPQVFGSVITPGRDLTKRYAEQGIRLVKDTYPAVYWYAFNMEDRVLGNSKSLRQALNLGFNVQLYIDVLFNGRAKPAVNTIPSSFKGWAEAGPSPYARFDIDAAKAKIEDARRELAAAGVIEPGGEIPELTLDIGGTDEYSRRIAKFAKGQFEQIGVRLRIEMNDWPTLQDKVDNKQCQIYSMGWHADYPDAENFLQLYYTPNIQRGTNNTNYSHPEFDRLYEQAAVTLEERKRIPLYAEMIRMINEDCPVLLLSEPVSFVLYHPWVHNSKPHPIGYGYLRYIRIDTAARAAAGGGR